MKYMAALEKRRGAEWGAEDEVEGFINIQSPWKGTSAQGSDVWAEDVGALRLLFRLSCASALAGPSDALWQGWSWEGGNGLVPGLIVILFKSRSHIMFLYVFCCGNWWVCDLTDRSVDYFT